VDAHLNDYRRDSEWKQPPRSGLVQQEEIMRNSNLIIIFLLVVLLHGCASINASDLRNSAKITDSIDVDVNYQLAHERILTKLRECNGEGSVGPGSTISIPNEIYSDLKKSSIAWTISGGGLHNYLLQIDLTAIGPNKTHIQSYVVNSNWKKTIDSLRSWATNPNSTC
jgi:hypothetical protein